MSKNSILGIADRRGKHFKQFGARSLMQNDPYYLANTERKRNYDFYTKTVCSNDK
jgi:hypothetical protein